jgi:enoyl-CoA hydratase
LSVAQDPEVIAARTGGLGRLTLNRPEALGALTYGMCVEMIVSLQAWRDDPGVVAVMIDHAGPRGFCAGGDIRALTESMAADGVAARAFFFTEYRLDHLIFTYPKPVITIMDGTVMGGGVGISLPARYRVATERTTFAMPEAGIGLFPDVGSGRYLSRLHGRTGAWLALTGARLKAADCELLGIATDVVESARLDEMKTAMVAEPEAIERILTEFEADPGPALAAGAHRDEIDRLFDQPSVEAVLTALDGEGTDWAKAQAEAIRGKCPASLKVAWRLLRDGAAINDFAEDMALEYRIALRMIARPDFSEGVRAVILDKDNAPRWRPATLEGMTDTELDAIFAPLPSDQAWSPLPESQSD